MRSSTELTDFGKVQHILTTDNYAIKKVYIKPKKDLKYDFHDKKLNIYIVVQGFVEVVYGFYKSWKGYGTSFTPPPGDPYIIKNNETTRVILLQVTVNNLKVPL